MTILQLRPATLCLCGLLLIRCGNDAVVKSPDTAQAVDAAVDAKVADTGQPDAAAEEASAAEVAAEVAAEILADAPPADTEMDAQPDAAPGVPCKVNSDCPPSTAPCTESRCEAKLHTCKVVQAIDGSACDDGEPCTLGDQCAAGQCLGGKPACNCKADSDCGAFDDGNLCNGKWVCNTNVSPSMCEAKAGTKVVCPPSDSQCALNVCNPATGACDATPTNDGGACEDGKLCTSGDHCKGGQCVPGDDACPCKKNSDCQDDGNLCNGVPYCDKSDFPWACKVNPATVISCSAYKDTACHHNICQPATGTCTQQPWNQGEKCDDGDLCTASETCDSGECKGGVTICGCQSDADCAKAEDGDLCNGTLFCNKTLAPHLCQVNPATVVTCPSADDTDCKANKCAPATGKCGWVNAKDASKCDDGNPCTTDDGCAAGACVAKTNICPCNNTGECAKSEDGNACNGTLFCDQSELPYVCKVNPSTVVTCPSVNDTSCARNLCQPASGKCAVTPVNNNVQCDADGNSCTLADTCKAGVCEPGPNTCACQKDSDCASQEDGNPCNGTLYCSKTTGTCLVNPNTVVVCNAAGDTFCKANQCDPLSGACKLTPLHQGQACDADGNLCTVGDVCDQGKCVAGTDTCGCKADADCKPFEDGNLCNGTLFCDKTAPPFQCKVNPATVVPCGAGTPPICQFNQCNPKSGKCEYTAVTDNSACEDGQLCTFGDTCTGGKCVSGANLCGCQADSDCASQEDGNFCNGNLYCDKSKLPFACKINPYSVVVCSTLNDTPCIKANCQPANGLCAAVALPDKATCDDGDACTTGETCAGGACTGSPAKCDDGSACTLDLCDPVSGCLAIANPAAACNDDNVCTTDTCDAKAGCAHGNAANNLACDDGDPCTSADACQTGVCKGVGGGGCDDGNPCTDDACLGGGKCTHTDNTNLCGGDLRCSGGVCGGCRAFGRPLRIGCDYVEDWPFFPPDTQPPHPAILPQCESLNNTNAEQGEDATELSDGRLVALGGASTDTTSATVGFVQWFAPGGTWLGDKTFGKAGTTRFLGASATADGGVWAAGHQVDAGSLRPWLVRVDATGKAAVDLILPTDPQSAGTVGAFEAVTRTSDDGALAVGWQQNPGSSTTDALACRFDAKGKLLWQTVLNTTTKNQPPQTEKFHGAAALRDGSGFVVVGQRVNPAQLSKNTQGWAVKFDPNGQWLWQRDFGGIGHDLLFGVALREDGGFLAVGTADKATVNAAGDGWAVLADSKGILVQEVKLPAGGDDVLRVVGYHAKRGWLMAGAQSIDHKGDASWSGNWDRGHAWFVRLDDKLAPVWQRTADYYGIETIRGGTVLREGDLWVAGDTDGGSPLNDKQPPNKPDSLALRVDGATGVDSCDCNFYERADAKAADPSRHEAVVVLENGTAVAAGWQAPNKIGDGWLQSMTSDGKANWSKTYGKAGDDRLYALARNGSGWVMVGSTDSNGAGGKDGWLVATDGNGVLQKDLTFGGNLDDELYKIVPLPDGGWLAVGRSKSLAKGDWDGWVMCLKADFSIAWEKRLGGPLEDGLRGVVVMPAATGWRALVIGHQVTVAGLYSAFAGYANVLMPDGSNANDSTGKPLEQLFTYNGGKPGDNGTQSMLFDATRLGNGTYVAVGFCATGTQGGNWWQRFDAEGHIGKPVAITNGVAPVYRQVLPEGDAGFVAVGEGGWGSLANNGDTPVATRVDANDKVIGNNNNFHSYFAGKWDYAMSFAGAGRLPNGHLFAVGSANTAPGAGHVGWTLQMDAYLFAGSLRFNGNGGFDNNCLMQRCSQHFPARIKNWSGNCTDDNECTQNDYCSVGQCKEYTLNKCDDGNPCTSDDCGPGAGCWHGPTGDGQACGGTNQTCGNGNCGTACASLLHVSAPLKKHEEYWRAAANPAGGWWVAGYAHPYDIYDNNGVDAFVGKIDSQGKLAVVYESAYATGFDSLDAVVPMPDGSVWMAGWVETPNNDRDNWLLHLDKDGKVLSDDKPAATKWQQTLRAYPSKNGWIFAGSKDNQVWWGERDTAGKVLWEQTASPKYPNKASFGWATASDIAVAPNGNYFLQVQGGDCCPGQLNDNLAMVVNSTSVIGQSATYGSSFNSYGRILAKPDGSAISVRSLWDGSRWALHWFPVSAEGTFGAAVKVPSASHQLLRDAALLPNGDLLLVGFAYKSLGNDWGAALFRVSPEGVILWDESPSLTSGAGQSLFEVVLLGPQAGQMTAFGFGYKDNKTYYDPWLKVAEIGGKLFCNGTEK